MSNVVDVTPTSCFTFDRENPSTARNVFATPIVLIWALTPREKYFQFFEYKEKHTNVGDDSQESRFGSRYQYDKLILPLGDEASHFHPIEVHESEFVV